MKAKEMFEELGYKMTIDKETIKDTLICYIKDDIDNINFNVESKYFSNTLYNVNNVNQEYLNKLNNAINQQCKELGWLEDK